MYIYINIFIHIYIRVSVSVGFGQVPGLVVTKLHGRTFQCRPVCFVVVYPSGHSWGDAMRCLVWGYLTFGEVGEGDCAKQACADFALLSTPGVNSLAELGE